MKRIVLFAAFFAVCFCAKAQLVINEVSQGTSGNKEYIELVVMGTRQCTDTSADLRGWIVDDNGGWFGTSAISAGCYRFSMNANWAKVPYGSIILFYNDGDKNGLITQADDPTDANNDGVYIVPITSTYIELNGSAPNSGSAVYPSTGFSASSSWTNMALNNNGDAVAVIKPTMLSAAYHSMTYGNLSGGTVHLTGSGGQKVYYVSGSQYNNVSGWVNGSAPLEETPGAPNTAANAAWINGMKVQVGGGASNDTTFATVCQGQSYAFNGITYSATGNYTFTYHLAGGCDSLVTLSLTVNPIPNAPSVVSPLTFCQADLAAPLAATGQNLLWYLSPAGGVGSVITPTPSTATSGNTAYYVSQTVSGCESPRSKIDVLVKPKPLPPVVATPLDLCQHAFAAPLAATGQNIKWYQFATGGSATATPPLPNTSAPSITNWYVSQSVNGCESGRAQLTVLVNEIVAAFTTNKDTICAMDTVRVTNNSTGAGLSNQWAFGDGHTDTAANPIQIYSSEGTYAITLVSTNSKGCKDTVTHRVFILPYPTLSFTNPDSIICQGEAVHLTGQVSPYYQSIAWDFGDGNVVYNTESAQHSYDTSGVFTISATTVNKGCPDRVFSSLVNVRPQPLVNIGPDTAMCPGNAPLQLSNASNSAGISYQWSTGETSSAILAQAPGIYWLRLSNGQCSSADSIEIFRSCYIDVPNVFTPNSDGLNDYFFPRQLLSRAMTSFSMQIFNRWGERIFESHSLDGRGWNGELNGLAQPTGVYVYLITASFTNSVQERYQGNVTLIR